MKENPKIVVGRGPQTLLIHTFCCYRILAYEDEAFSEAVHSKQMISHFQPVHHFCSLSFFIRVRCVGLHVFLLFSIVPCFHNLIMLKLFQWSAKTPMKTTPPVGEIIANTRQYLVETIAYVFQEKEDTPFFEQAVSSAVGFILFTYLSACSTCST